MISNYVRHLGVIPTPQSPISPVTPRDRRRLRAERRRLRIPRWKINSCLSEISVCWSCTEKITFKIERAFSVILRASPAIPRSFQPSPQHQTVLQQTSLNTQLSTANASWRLSNHTIVDSISDLSSACWHKRLLIEVATVAVAFIVVVTTFIVIDVATIVLASQLGANF